MAHPSLTDERWVFMVQKVQKMRNKLKLLSRVSTNSDDESKVEGNSRGHFPDKSNETCIGGKLHLQTTVNL